MHRDKVMIFFVKADDFHKEFAIQLKNHPKLGNNRAKHRTPKCRLLEAEMMKSR